MLCPFDNFVELVFRCMSFSISELLQLIRLVMKQREELQRGREVESESMKSDLSDCQTPFYSSEQEENNRVSVNTRICFVTHSLFTLFYWMSENN